MGITVVNVTSAFSLGNMTTVVYLQLKDGQQLRFSRASNTAAATKVRSCIEGRVRVGVTLSLANSRGVLEKVNLSNVDKVEMAEEVTPSRGSMTIRNTD